MPNFTWALQQATGVYIALCDGDDYWNDPLKIQKQVDFLEKNEDYVLVFHKIKILRSDSGDLVEDFITKVPEKHENLIDIISGGNYIHTPSVIFRNVVQEYSFELKYSTIGDYFLYIILGIMVNINNLIHRWQYIDLGQEPSHRLIE